MAHDRPSILPCKHDLQTYLYPVIRLQANGPTDQLISESVPGQGNPHAGSPTADQPTPIVSTTQYLPSRNQRLWPVPASLQPPHPSPTTPCTTDPHQGFEIFFFHVLCSFDKPMDSLAHPSLGMNTCTKPGATCRCQEGWQPSPSSTGPD
jgi:hypothetical protein